MHRLIRHSNLKRSPFATDALPHAPGKAPRAVKQDDLAFATALLGSLDLPAIAQPPSPPAVDAPPPSQMVRERIELANERQRILVAAAAASAQTPAKRRHSPGPPSPSTAKRRRLNDPTSVAAMDVDTPSRHGPVVDAEGPKALERLTDLLDDIFASDDALVFDSGADSRTEGAMETDPPDRPTQHFDPTTRLLEPATIRLVLRRIGEARAGVASVNEDALGRLLRIFERTIKAAEDVRPIPARLAVRRTAAATETTTATKPAPKARKSSAAAAKSAVKSSGGGKKRGRAPSRSSSRVMTEDEIDDLEDDDGTEADYTPTSVRSTTTKPTPRSTTRSGSRSRSVTPSEKPPDGLAWTDAELTALETGLRAFVDGLAAVETALAMLTAARLGKQLYSEDLISSCVGVVKSAVESVVFPFAECGSDTSEGTFADSGAPLTAQVAQVCWRRR